MLTRDEQRDLQREIGDSASTYPVLLRATDHTHLSAIGGALQSLWAHEPIATVTIGSDDSCVAAVSKGSSNDLPSWRGREA